MSQATTPRITDRQRAIIEAGRLIDALTDGDGEQVKESWYQLGKFVRPALAEIRVQETQHQLRHTAPNEFLSVG